MKKNILLLGTMDTKGREFGYVKERIIKEGHGTIVVDAGILGTPLLVADISSEKVAQAAGTDIQDVILQGKEGVAIEIMTRGASSLVQGLYYSGKFDGILALGGSMGTSLATAVMRSLPLGIPKVMVSTMASSDTRPYLDNKDIVMVPSVADIVGLNRLTKRVLTIAAGAIIGMVTADPGAIQSEKPLIGLTLHGDLMPCMHTCKNLLERKGYEVVIFAAVGSGGKSMEELIEKGVINGVFDLVTHEVACHLFGGLCDAGPSRLEAAGRKGIPQLIIPGKVDIITFSTGLGPPLPFKDRRVWMHNPDLGLIRLNKEEMSLVGETMAEKLNKAIGPTAVIIPERGVSGYGKGWEEFYDRESDLAFFKILKRRLKPEIRVVEVDSHINDRLFAERATDLLDELMHKAV
ncbi:MAG: Tm-1-like ATP-binding domain-containing protein [Desulfobacteraceae bacterium]|nr:Tm-1-like ATP-binding domain-containing protein [Desulfobacteraceae bacterium]